jgi:hypothetical protein
MKNRDETAGNTKRNVVIRCPPVSARAISAASCSPV